MSSFRKTAEQSLLADVALVLALGTAALLLCVFPRTTFAARMTSAEWTALCREFKNYDVDGDGRAEVYEIAPAPDLTCTPEMKSKKLILLLVEKRLWSLDEKTGAKKSELRAALTRYAKDIAAEGWDVAGVLCDLYRGPVHKDGRIVLALRWFLRDVRDRDPRLAGVILIGDFPEAYLVRNYFWKKYCPYTLHKGKPDEKKFDKVHLWRCVPECVAKRCDAVLADLDGRWEDVYVQDRCDLPTFVAVFPNGTGEEAGGVTDLYDEGSVSFEDFFYMNDGRWAVRKLDGGKVRMIRIGPRNDVCTDEDKRLPNPMPMPEIFVSRINARHVGVRIMKSIKGVKGEGLLNDRGEPQTVTFPDAKSVPRAIDVWERDPAMERRLLLEFFDRDHRFRSGKIPGPFRPGCITTEWGNSVPTLRKLFPAWANFDEKGYAVVGKKTSLLDAIEWFKRPILLRALKAHSDPWGCTFGATKNIDKLVKAVGGKVWAWHREGNKLVPGLVKPQNKLDFVWMYPMWRNGVLSDCPWMMLHTGCESTACGGAGTLSYSDPQYGYWQHTENMLFYLNGLVLVGRAKVFNDEPRGLFEALAKGKCWGDAWLEYFRLDSRDASLNTDASGVARKRAFFWNETGDATLRMPRSLMIPNPPPMAGKKAE